MLSATRLKRSAIFVLTSVATALLGVWFVHQVLPSVHEPSQIRLHIDRGTPLAPRDEYEVTQVLQSPQRLAAACQAAGVDPDEPWMSEALQSLSIVPASDGAEMMVAVDRQVDGTGVAQWLEQVWRLALPMPPVGAPATPDDVRHAEANTEHAREELARAEKRVQAFFEELSHLPPPPAAGPAPVRMPRPTLAPPQAASPGPTTTTTRSPAERRLADLERQRGELLQRLTPAHPQVVALDEQIDAVRAHAPTPAAPQPAPRPTMTLPDEPVTSTAPAPTDPSAQARATAIASLAAAQADVERATGELSAAQRTEREARRRAYENITPVALERFTVTIERPAPMPARPMWLASVGMLAMLAGLNAANMLPRETPTRYRSVDDIERHLKVPVLTVIPPERVDS